MEEVIPNCEPLIVETKRDGQDFVAAIEKDMKKNIVFSQINKLYSETICRFRKGELLVYNPNLFIYLTKEKFFTWIFRNNPEIGNLFS